MLEQIDTLLRLVGQTPPVVVYVLLGLGTAAENIFPPVPSDTFVLVGAVLAEEGFLRYSTVFLVAWAGNVGLALAVYAAGRRYGRAIFDTRWGKWLLRPHQLRRLAEFYDRYGTWTVLFSRFFPVFRVLVPAFAGISRLGGWRTGLPLAAASAVWYAILLAAGGLAARNLPRIIELASRVNWTLWAVAAALAAAVGYWWWKGRHPED